VRNPDYGDALVGHGLAAVGVALVVLAIAGVL
jgi:hypothetical protein